MIYYVKGLWWSLVGARRSTQTLQNTYATAVAVRMRPPKPVHLSSFLLASCFLHCAVSQLQPPFCCCVCSSSYLLAWLIFPSLCIFSSQMVEEAAAEQDTIEGADPATATTTATPDADGKTDDLTTAAKSSGSGSGSPRVLSVSDAVLWGAMRAQTELLRRKEPLMSSSTHAAAAAAASDTVARRVEAEAYLATAGAARVEPRVTHAQMFFIVGVALVTMQVRNASFFRPNLLVSTKAGSGQTCKQRILITKDGGVGW